MQRCGGFISAESLNMFRALDARNMLSDSAEIKPAQCCIKLVFYLTCTKMHGNTKVKFMFHIFSTGG